jgi:hypothetical protein
MTIMTMTGQQCRSSADQSWFPWLTMKLSWFEPKRRPHLDVRELSPHLQRDLGFLDGNDPSGRRS